MAEDPWWQSALCAQVDPALFHLAVGDNANTAKKICARCEVRLQCLSEDITFPVQGPGIFGGFGSTARRRMHDRVERGRDADEVAIRAIERQAS